MLVQHHGLVALRPRWNGMGRRQVGLAIFISALLGFTITLLLFIALPTALRRIVSAALAWFPHWSLGGPLANTESVGLMALCACCGGLIAGGAQWLILPRAPRSMLAWMLATALGCTVGTLLARYAALLLHEAVLPDLAWTFTLLIIAVGACAIGGSVVGAVQSLVVWSTPRERLEWSCASATGWGLASGLIVLWLIH